VNGYRQLPWALSSAVAARSCHSAIQDGRLIPRFLIFILLTDPPSALALGPPLPRQNSEQRYV